MIWIGGSQVWQQLARGAFWALMTALPTSVATAVTFRLKLGRWPRRHEPMSFNDRLHEGKRTWRDPLMTRMVDKVLAKDYVAGILGADWVTPTLYAGPHLPPRAERNWPYPYVIKANHTSGTNYFVRSRADEDWDKIERIVKTWLSKRHNPKTGEWPYIGVIPNILVEPMIGGGKKLPPDFKIYVFSGIARFIQVIPERETNRNNIFFDRNWRRENFCQMYDVSGMEIRKPTSLNIMLDAAERLSQGRPFVRIDLYEVAGQPRFGEITFFPYSGRARFETARQG